MHNLPGVRRLAAFLTLSAAVCIAATPSAQAQAAPTSRAEAVAIVEGLTRIVSEHGVDRLEAVPIGGIPQWISVRGADRRNPILLFLHGGPGFPMMPMSWTWQRDWEDYFTVVQWDQRGAGKTFAGTDPAKIAPTMSVDRMEQDAIEVITWLRREYGKDRIFVAGHSWGSVIGLRVARDHPEWLYAYIGMGQMIDIQDSEHRGWQFALDAAQADHNAEAVGALQALAPYSTPGHLPSADDLFAQRKWLGYYGGAVHGQHGLDAAVATARLSPAYSDADIAAFGAGADWSFRALLPELTQTHFRDITRLHVPVILFNGRYDYNVSQDIAAAWFARLKAPSKHLVWFENSAHVMMIEEPGKTLVELVRLARPIAERAGDVAPK